MNNNVLYLKLIFRRREILNKYFFQKLTTGRPSIEFPVGSCWDDDDDDSTKHKDADNDIKESTFPAGVETEGDSSAIYYYPTPTDRVTNGWP